MNEHINLANRAAIFALILGVASFWLYVDERAFRDRVTAYSYFDVLRGVSKAVDGGATSRKLSRLEACRLFGDEGCFQKDDDNPDTTISFRDGRVVAVRNRQVEPLDYFEGLRPEWIGQRVRIDAAVVNIPLEASSARDLIDRSRGDADVHPA